MLSVFLTSTSAPSPTYAAQTAGNVSHATSAPAVSEISTYWPSNVQQWGNAITKVAHSHGIAPDLVASVVFSESGGDPNGVSHVGAVGLMGVMPSSPGLEWRPSSEELTNPGLNLRWGVAILADILRQSGGDISAALAAYSGGWHNATRTVPRQYAAQVIDNYSRAVLVTSGFSPDIADRWTLAIEVSQGHVSHNNLQILGEQPLSGFHTYAEHIIYNAIGESGRAYRIKGYIVPVAYIVPTPDPIQFGQSDTIEDDLNVKLGTISNKEQITKSPRVIIACLPSISRLRGQQNQGTRWFAPSSCPNWHR